MRYIVETIWPSEDLVTIDYHKTFSGAKEEAEFLKDEYHVETEIYSECDYVELHPEKFDISAEEIRMMFSEPDVEQDITIMWIHGVSMQDTVGP